MPHCASRRAKIPALLHWYRANPLTLKTAPTSTLGAAPAHLNAVQRRHPHVQKDPVQHRHRDVLQNSRVRC